MNSEQGPNGDQSRPSDEECLLISYIELRRVVGCLGLALPFVLLAGTRLLEGPGIRNSISAYYHSSMRDVFVGILCAIGVFLFTYKGYTKGHDRATSFAALAAIGVALCPTTPEFGATATQAFVGIVHLCFATAFFSLIGYISLVFFTQNTPNRPMTRNKERNNRVYRGCGWTIFGAIGLIAIISWLPLPMTSWLLGYRPVFWLESLAVVAFAVSWLTKGGVLSSIVRTILRTRESGPRRAKSEG
jgi:hypothetical protein